MFLFYHFFFKKGIKNFIDRGDCCTLVMNLRALFALSSPWGSAAGDGGMRNAIPPSSHLSLTVDDSKLRFDLGKKGLMIIVGGLLMYLQELLINLFDFNCTILTSTFFVCQTKKVRKENSPRITIF